MPAHPFVDERTVRAAAGLTLALGTVAFFQALLGHDYRLMWLEAVPGVCLGCQVHRLLVVRGLLPAGPDLVCADGACSLPVPPPAGSVPASRS